MWVFSHLVYKDRNKRIYHCNSTVALNFKNTLHTSKFWISVEFLWFLSWRKFSPKICIMKSFLHPLCKLEISILRFDLEKSFFYLTSKPFAAVMRVDLHLLSLLQWLVHFAPIIGFSDKQNTRIYSSMVLECSRCSMRRNETVITDY